MSAHEHERLSAYLDGELAPETMAAVAAHVAACADCAARLAEFAAVDEAAAALATTAPSEYFEAFPARLRSRLSPRPIARRLPAWTWAVAAALLLAVVAPLGLQKRPEAGKAEREVSVAAPPPATRTADSRGALPSPAPAGAPAAAPQPLRESPVRAKVQPLPPTVGAAPGAGAAGANAAPASPKEQSARGYAQAPAETDVAASAMAPDGRRDTAAAPAPRPASGTPAAQTNAQADLARQAIAAAEKDEPAARARDEAAASADDKAAAVEAQAQAAPAAKVARSQAPGRLAEPISKAPASGSEEEWRRLLAARPQSAAEWRRLREQFRRFVDAAPAGPHADEARVGTIEAGYSVWRSGSDAVDEAVFRRDAAAYLAREDAQSKPRVEALVTRAAPGPTP